MSSKKRRLGTFPDKRDINNRNRLVGCNSSTVVYRHMDRMLLGEDDSMHVSGRHNQISLQTAFCLQKILGSVFFFRSARIIRLLRFIVERTLAGATDDLKEYVIGIEVFDRDVTFDPRLDPIVRVEVRRLRSKLREYYDLHAHDDRLRIEIPPGGYTAKFHISGDGGPPAEVLGIWPSSGHALAVLPLVSLSMDPEDEFFADGLTDDVVHLLVNCGNVHVAAGTSAFQFKGKVVDARVIGAQLNVGYILEGSIRRENSTVRVSVHLINARSGFRTWSQVYQQNLLGILATQKKIAGAIAADLTLQLSEAKCEHAARSLPQSNLNSLYPMYMAGRSQLNARTENGIKQSIQYFDQIIGRDPIFALAHAGLAEAYSLGARYHFFPPQESWNRARNAAVAALRIDDSLAEAHTALAFVDLHQRRDCWSADRGFSRAIALNPNYATARQWYAWCLAAAGCHELAISNIKHALDMDPVSANANADLALALYFARQYDDSINQCRRAAALAPNFYRPYQLAGLAYLQKGNYEAAMEQFQLAIDLSGGDHKSFVLLAHAFAAMGKADDARTLLNVLIERRSSYVPAINFALLYSVTGNHDRMFEWLEMAYLEDDGELIWLAIDPIYDGARRDARFAAFLDHIAHPMPSSSDYAHFRNDVRTA